MRNLSASCVLLFLLAALPPAAADEAPAPRLDRVDHTNPKILVSLGKEVGAGPRTLGIAKQLRARGKTTAGTLSEIVRWVGRNLRVDASRREAFSSVEDIIVRSTVEGDADRAYMIGVFARAVGIPTVWVKSLEKSWLKRFQAAPKAPREPVGRTFLEVYVDKRWMLLDPVTAKLYKKYSVQTRDLPDGHIAYDRGGDPFKLVLANRWKLWRAQLLKYAPAIKLAQAAYGAPSDLLAKWRVFVTGKGSAATYAREAAKTLGFLLGKTSARDDKWLANARGKTILVTMGSDGVPALPRKYWASYFGATNAKMLEAGGRPRSTWLANTLSDGTRVILITVRKYGPVELAVSEALEG